MQARSSVLYDSPLVNQVGSDVVAQAISVTTIDAFVAEHRLPRVDYIKIDTEGYGAKLLAGASNTIRADRPVIAMAAYHTPSDEEELPRIVGDIATGYRCTVHRERELDLICVPDGRRPSR